MATCNECIYEPQCISRISYGMGDDEVTGKLLPDIEKRCPSFKSNADVVEVVRCKDCKYLSIMNSESIFARCARNGYAFFSFDTDIREHYCAYGEKREEQTQWQRK